MYGGDNMLYPVINFFDENICPKCKGRIILVDIDVTISQLERDGSIRRDLDSIKEGCVSYLYCTKCKSKFDFRKKGNYIRMTTKDQIAKIENDNPFYQ